MVYLQLPTHEYKWGPQSTCFQLSELINLLNVGKTISKVWLTTNDWENQNIKVCRLELTTQLHQ